MTCATPDGLLERVDLERDNFLSALSPLEGRTAWHIQSGLVNRHQLRIGRFDQDGCLWPNRSYALARHEATPAIATRRPDSDLTIASIGPRLPTGVSR